MSSVLDEAVSQLDFELRRFAGSSSPEPRRRVAEALLDLRVGFLLATRDRPEPFAGFVTELELVHFLESTGESVEPRPAEELLGPARGVTRARAEAFCSWIERWSDGEVKGVRLPTVREAERAFGGRAPSAWLEGLSAEAEVGAWCSDGFSCLRSLPVIDKTVRFVEALLRFDLHFYLRTGIKDLSSRHMPVRDDSDFAENYERDRRYVGQYAAGLVAARDELRRWDEKRGTGLGALLAFEPLENLRGASPLDSQRGLILSAFWKARDDLIRCVDETGLPSVEEMRFEYFGPAETARVADACRRQARCGVDRAALASRLGSVPREEGLHQAETLARLERLVTAKEALGAAQLMTLDAWYATDMGGEGDRSSWWMRLQGRQPLRPRSLLASVYADLAVLDERSRGRLSAFEGIRLVREG